jgi:hypothetical protein
LAVVKGTNVWIWNMDNKILLNKNQYIHIENQAVAFSICSNYLIVGLQKKIEFYKIDTFKDEDFKIIDEF